MLQGATELVVARHYGSALVFVTPLALLLGQLGLPQPLGPLLIERLAETFIGVTIGVAVAIGPWNRPATVDDDGLSTDGSSGG